MLRKKKPEAATFAFLDLDNTLINTSATKLNQSLLDALKEQGIRDICLFTSMNHRQISDDLTNASVQYSRPAIIAELKKQGFVVHRVMTPSDQYLENPKPGDYYTKKWLPAFKKAKKVKKEDSQQLGEIADITKQVDEDIDEYTKQVEKQAAEIVQIGNKSEEAKKKANDYMAMHKDNKGDMYQLACGNLDTISKENGVSVGSIVFFDDSIEELHNVAEKSKELGHPVPLTCVEIRTKSQNQPNDIASPDQAEVKKRYSNALSKHKEMVENKRQALATLKDAVLKEKVPIDDVNQLCQAVSKIQPDRTKPPVSTRVLVEIANHHEQVWNVLVKQAEAKFLEENFLGFKCALEISNGINENTVGSLFRQWNHLWSEFLSETSPNQINIAAPLFDKMNAINTYIDTHGELPDHFKNDIDLLVSEMAKLISVNGLQIPLFLEIESFAKNTVSLQTPETVQGAKKAIPTAAAPPTPTRQKPGVDVVMSATNKIAFQNYLTRIQEAIKNNKISLNEEYKQKWQPIIGERFFIELKKYHTTNNKNIREMTLDDFIKCLFKTTMYEIYPEKLDVQGKKPQFGAETTQLKWNSTEHHLLANSPKVIRGVTPFTKDTYDPTSLINDKELDRVKGRLDFILFNGPLVSEYNPREFDRCFKDATLIVKLRDITDEIDHLTNDASEHPENAETAQARIKELNQEKQKIMKLAMEQFDSAGYKQLLKERMLPGLLLLNGENPNGFIFTTPALGCEAYAGSFKGLMDKKFIEAFKEIILENQDKLPNLKGVILAGLKQPGKKDYYQDVQIGKTPFIITDKGIGTAPQFDEHVKEKIKDCEKYKIVVGVAGDTYSNAANEYNNLNGGSQEAAVFKYTDALKIVTGQEGKREIKDDKCLGYKPKKEEDLNAKKDKKWSECYSEGTAVNDINHISLLPEKRVKQFLSTLKNLLDNGETYLQAKTFSGSTTITNYQIILNLNMPPVDQYMEILRLANHALIKREHSGAITTFFKYSGDSAIVTQLHRFVASADFDIKGAAKQIKNMDQNINKERSKLNQDLAGTFMLDANEDSSSTRSRKK